MGAFRELTCDKALFFNPFAFLRRRSFDWVTNVDNIEVKDDAAKLQYVAAHSAANGPTTTGIYCVFTISGNQSDIYYSFTSPPGLVKRTV